MNASYSLYVGVPCVDAYYEIDRWPLEGDKFLGSFMGNTSGGMVANAACISAALGRRTFLFCRLGDNDGARFLLEDLSRYGVDVSRVDLVPGRKDLKCFIFLSGAERTVMVVPGDEDRIPLSAAEEEFFLGAEYIYTTLSELGHIDGAEELLCRYKAGGGKLVLDCESTSYDPGWRSTVGLASIVFMNESALEVFAEGGSAEQLEREILDSGVEMLVETLGARGSRVLTRSGCFSTGVYDVPVTDTTGAGDTFNSSFVFALSKNRPPEEAAAFATAAADMAIMRQGPRTGAVPESEVLRFMESHELK